MQEEIRPRHSCHWHECNFFSDGFWIPHKQNLIKSQRQPGSWWIFSQDAVDPSIFGDADSIVMHECTLQAKNRRIPVYPLREAHEFWFFILSRPESSNLCLTIAQNRRLKWQKSTEQKQQRRAARARDGAWGIGSGQMVIWTNPFWKATARSLGDLFFFLSTNRPVFQGMTLRFVCSYSHFSIAMFFWHSALVRFGAGWIRPAEKRLPPPAGWSVFWILQHTTWTVAIPF